MGLCYNGLAFRHQPAEPDRPTQFYQAGAELLGVENRAAAETEILTLTVEALRAAGLDDFEMKLGDLSLFSAFVNALDIPPQWRARLKRHFWRGGYFEALLARLSRGARSGTQRLLAHLGTLDEAEARPAFEGLMDLIGEAPQGGRTREEIVDRLIEQAADAAALKLDSRITDSIAKLLAISGPAAKAIEQIRALTKSAGVSLDAPLRAMSARLATLKTLGVAPERVTFAARFGRFLEDHGHREMDQLGAKRAIPAIGVAIRTERVLAARTARRKVPR